MVRRQVCYQRLRNGGLGMPDMENHWFAERLTYLGCSMSKDTVRRRKVSDTVRRLKSDPKAEDRRKLKGEAPFVHECCRALCNLPGSSDFSRPRKELYRELVAGSVSDLLVDRLGWSMEEFRSHWNWVPGSGFLNNSPGGLHETRKLFSAWITKRAWQTCLNVLAAAVTQRKLLSRPSTIASVFARFGITSGRGRPTSNPNSSCCSTLVTS